MHGSRSDAQFGDSMLVARNLYLQTKDRVIELMLELVSILTVCLDSGDTIDATLSSVQQVKAKKIL